MYPYAKYIPVFRFIPYKFLHENSQSLKFDSIVLRILYKF